MGRAIVMTLLALVSQASETPATNREASAQHYTDKSSDSLLDNLVDRTRDAGHMDEDLDDSLLAKAGGEVEPAKKKSSPPKRAAPAPDEGGFSLGEAWNNLGGGFQTNVKPAEVPSPTFFDLFKKKSERGKPPRALPSRANPTVMRPVRPSAPMRTPFRGTLLASADGMGITTIVVALCGLFAGFGITLAVFRSRSFA